MKRLAFLCPGQGAQHVGMGTDLCREFAQVRQTFAQAQEALGFDLKALCESGPEQALTLTTNTQPALLTMSVAIARVLKEEGGLEPAIAAGHSLGEWSAWVIVGALDFGQALEAVRQRGRFMQEAVEPGVGAMTAILGTDLEVIQDLCAKASQGPQEVVVPANLNGGGQIVVAGHRPAVERLEAAVAGRFRTSRLAVSAPFHSPLMEPAAQRLEPILDSLRVSPPTAPVVTNVEAQPLLESQEISSLLGRQVTGAVRWEECARAVVSDSDAAIEVGPGRVLCGLLRRVDRRYVCRPTATVEGVRKVIEEFGQ